MTTPIIGITQGNTNGTGYEIILKAFEDPTFLELCTPVVYGNKNAATAHRRMMEIQTNFITISDVENAQEEKLNILECIEGERNVSFGAENPEAEKDAETSLSKALQDAEDERIEGLVLSPAATSITCPEDAMEMLIAPDVRLAITEDITIKEIEKLHLSMERDFGCRAPRLAIITKEEKDFSELLKEADSKHICTYGPYAMDDFFESMMYTYFDAFITTEREGAMRSFSKLSEQFGITYFAGCNPPIASIAQDAMLNVAGKGTASIANLCNAIYTIKDALRNRDDYDEARVNPLPKLFHDKREDRRINGNTID